MYASIRRYDGVKDPLLAARRVRESFVPLIRAIDGFVAYFWTDAGNGLMVSTSVFESQAAAEESNRKASAWVRDNLPGVFPTPQITAGPVVAGAIGAQRAEEREAPGP